MGSVDFWGIPAGKWTPYVSHITPLALKSQLQNGPWSTPTYSPTFPIHAFLELGILYVPV